MDKKRNTIDDLVSAISSKLHSKQKAIVKIGPVNRTRSATEYSEIFTYTCGDIETKYVIITNHEDYDEIPLHKDDTTGSISTLENLLEGFGLEVKKTKKEKQVEISRVIYRNSRKSLHQLSDTERAKLSFYLDCEDEGIVPEESDELAEYNSGRKVWENLK